MPAAVMRSGKKRGESSAPIRTALYPAHKACEVNASIDCAREIRGTNSKDIAVTLALTAASIESAAVVGDRNEIVMAPFFNDFIASGASGWTERTTSAELVTSPLVTVAPAAVN